MLYSSVILNPDYRFKNDIDRIVLYSGKHVQEYSSPEWISYIHPVQAMILGAFTQNLSFLEVCKLLSIDLKMPLENVEKLIQPFVGNEEPVYTMFGGQKILFPKNVLIDTSKKATIEKREMQSCDLNCTDINLIPDRMHRAPQTLLFMLTNKCVTKCKYCYADRKTRYHPLATEKILDIIEEAAQLEMTYIDVIGGEVFCRKNWDTILKKMVDLNLTPNYISTKVPIHENDIKRLKDTGYNNVVQISLDSLDDDILNNIIGCGVGYVEKMKKTIKLLCENGFTVQIDTILTKLNSTKESIKDLFEYIKDIPHLAYWEIRVPELSIYTPTDFGEIQASRQQLKQLDEFIKDLISRANFTIYYSEEALHDGFRKGKPDDECFNGGACGILQERLFVLPDGKVSVCEQLYWHPQFIIGDLNHQTISEAWNSPKAIEIFEQKKEMFRQNSKCHDCRLLESCNNRHRRCFVKVIKAYGADNWDYPDPRCVYAPNVKSNLLYK